MRVLLFSIGRSLLLAAVAGVAAVAVTGTALTGALAGSQASSSSTSAQTINGYTITTPTYVLNANTPSIVDSVKFTIVNPGHLPSLIKVQTTGTWVTCTAVANVANYDVTCLAGWTLTTNFTGTLSIVIRK